MTNKRAKDGESRGGVSANLRRYATRRRRVSEAPKRVPSVVRSGAIEKEDLLWISDIYRF